MYRFKRSAAAAAAAVMLFLQPLTAYAIGPGEGLSYGSSSAQAQAPAGAQTVTQPAVDGNVITSTVPDNSITQQGSSAAVQPGGQDSAPVVSGSAGTTGVTPGNAGGQNVTQAASPEVVNVGAATAPDGSTVPHETAPDGSTVPQETTPVVTGTEPQVQTQTQPQVTGTQTQITGAQQSSSASYVSSAAQAGVVTTSGKALPKISIGAESIRGALAVSSEGDVQADPVLNLVPLATYFIYNSNGARLDYGYSHVKSSLVYAGEGFNRMMLEHQNVGRYYYRTYSKNAGWGPWACSKETTPDQGKVQAVQFRLKGYSHKFGELYYKAVLNDGTVTDWAPAGQACGVIGDDRYIVALKLILWRQGQAFPYSTEKPLDNVHSEGVYYQNGAQYSTADGHAYTGWGYDADSNAYYFVNGQRATGWTTINGFNIYFDGDGRVVKDLSGIMGNPGNYSIRINKATRTMYVMTADSADNHTIPYKTLMITVGDDTPLGTYKIYEKYRWHFMHPNPDCYCQFLSRFYKGFLIHSLLYERADKNSMDAIYYNYMDDSMSGGCVRLRAVDCAWIYYNCPNGTQVTIYSDPWDKGPIEKDAIEQAIPRDQTWDPTDPEIVAQQTAEQKAAAEAAIKQAQADAAAGFSEPV